MDHPRGAWGWCRARVAAGPLARDVRTDGTNGECVEGGTTTGPTPCLPVTLHTPTLRSAGGVGEKGPGRGKSCRGTVRPLWTPNPPSTGQGLSQIRIRNGGGCSGCAPRRATAADEKAADTVPLLSLTVSPRQGDNHSGCANREASSQGEAGGWHPRGPVRGEHIRASSAAAPASGHPC